ncbi:hypothetical protein RB195_014903 [Necator americanus]|uniref:Cation/H+ exchanger transmembrane domain-containing protein n=1 Tax=Necator americanus TaxID=51031 RepID=A0ABR1E244_NECAM
MSFLGIPDSVLQFLIALFTSIMMNKFLPADIAIDLTERYSWTTMDPQTLMMVMLPPLLFESSFKINSHMFFAKLRLIVCLTVVAYFITLFVATAFMLPMVIQTQKFNISAVFLFVAIIVATDPVAVVAILEQYGAPYRLRILIEGESLLNDGLALTTYRFLFDIFKVEIGVLKKIDLPQQFFSLFMNVVASPLFGVIGAKIVAWIISKLRENKKRQAFILVSVYGVFNLCEKCSGSPALGLVVFGIMLSSYREMFAPETSQMALELWAAMGYWANNVIFIFAGFCVGNEMFTHNAGRQLRDTDYLEIEIEDLITLIEGMLLAPIPLVARIASIFLFYKYHGLLSSRSLPPRRDFIILAYAGLRGALGLILAMELRHRIGGTLTKKILLLTCSTTFICLVFQGMTFSNLATKEGTTKRSKYVKDTCVRLCRFLNVKIREALHVMQHNRKLYLIGANWHVVETQVRGCLDKHAAEMEDEMMIQQQDDLVQSDRSDEENCKQELNKDVIDARVGFYGILLARVHDAWARGALSGSTAHVIITILEHGIDEGRITADDIEHHLGIIELNCFDRMMCKLSEFLFNWICHDTWLNKFAEIGDHPLLSIEKSNVVTYVTRRTFERWWIFHTGLMCIYTILLAYVNYDEVSDVTRAVIYMLCSVTWIMNVLQTIYVFHKDDVRWRQKYDEFKLSGGKRPHRTFIDRLTSKEFVPNIFLCVLNTTSFILSIIILHEGYCITGKDFHSVQCQCLRHSAFVMMLLATLYKLTRMTPLFVVVLREHCIEMMLLRARIRLAIFHYLNYLMTETKISPDLFSEAAYKTARKEVTVFNQVIEGLMRLELKENPSKIDVVPVMKTRQAIRMMSYEMQEILNVLKTEGFMPADSEEKWGEVVTELRVSADGILWTPKLAFLDWLECIKWIGSLRESSRQKVVEILNNALCSSPVSTRTL